MLFWYVGESCSKGQVNTIQYIPRQNNIDFESAREILMKEDDEMVVKRQFEGIYDMIEFNSYTKYEENPENKEIFVYG